MTTTTGEQLDMFDYNPENLLRRTLMADLQEFGYTASAVGFSDAMKDGEAVRTVTIKAARDLRAERQPEEKTRAKARATFRETAGVPR